RTQTLSNEKTAVTQLESLLVAFQFESNSLSKNNVFDSRQVTSTDDDSLSGAVSLDGNPAVGAYQFTPVQTASTQQLLSQAFGATAAVGAGSLTFGTGGFVDPGISLDDLNSGAGVQRGKIRITDRSGASAVIDLSYARSVDDVLDAINGNTDINVSATAVGDSFKLTDNTGGTGNLKVQEVGGGKTASNLGLAGIDVSAATATGVDVFTLSAKTSLTSLNDGTGVQLKSGSDLSITLADGSSLGIDLGDAKTLGDVITAINTSGAGKLSASISTDGNRIQLTDLTTGSGTFAVANVGTGTAANDLGLTSTAVSNTISGSRLVSGLRDSLISSLKGGAGLGTLGHISITNRNNVASDVNLSGAETLGDIVTAINSQATGVTASINTARNGIQLTDTTGGSASNFIVSDADSTGTASSLGIATNAAATTINSGGLQRRQISSATLLSSLNGGAGINVGDFNITGTNGVTAAVDLNQIGNIATTIGDVLNRINSLPGVGVQAKINDRGDGIELVDTASGGGNISVTPVGNSTTASDLRLLGTSTAQTVDGLQRQVIDGTATATVAIDSDDTLSDVVKKINALNRGVTASILNDGTRQRLSLSANSSGAANELLVDTSNSSLGLQEISSGRDALVVYGSVGSGGVLISSSTNKFSNIVNGLDLTINNGSQTPVTINVASSDTALVSGVNDFVSAYNSLRTTLDKLTAFDPVALTTGLLFGSNETLQVDSSLTRLIGAKYFGVGQFDSLASVGITFDKDGQMQLDQSKLTAAFDKDPASVKSLFTDAKNGFAPKLSATIDQFAGETNSLLSAKVDSLDDTIDSNNKRIAQMTDSLARQKDALLAEFDNLETTVAGLKSNLTALQSLQVLPPISSATKAI
ncbi:MAG TPA: flagellar filament capping protein FliD, partial [Lacipirellulaceae bacterium]|nr:flagellar filament capping protein FliD [Lacipirellulaceae bacterium]